MSNSSPRYLQRELALRVLFSFFQYKKENVAEFTEYVKREFFPKLKNIDLAKEIIEKVILNKEKNIEWITEFAKSFSIEKTNPMDIVILEMIITEIFYLEEKTPVPVAVNELLKLASEYWKNWSTPFINWVIGKIVKKYAEPSESSK